METSIYRNQSEIYDNFRLFGTKIQKLLCCYVIKKMLCRFCFISVLLLFIQSCLMNSSLNGQARKPEIRCQDGDQKVFLVDNLLGSDELKFFSGFMQRHRPWVLNYQDKYQEGLIDMKCNTTWVSPISLELFEHTRLWKILSGIVKELTAKDYYLCHAMFTMTYRMDFNPVSNDDHGLMVGIFLNKDMKKNDYGEKVFYNTNNSDIMCGVYPVPGRVLIWNSSIHYVAKPPSMLYVQSQNSIVLKLTDSREKYQNCQDLSKENKESVLQAKPQAFPFTVDKSEKLRSIELGNVNYENHLSNKYYDAHGREIAVFDDILTNTDLDLLRAYLVKDYHSFGFQPYDTDKTEDHDNVAWISTQKVEVLVKSGLWKVVKQAAQYLSGLNEWYPYDVSMNIVHSFHHTRIHEDCEPHQYEYTFLLYLNPDWNENDYGETVFFNLVNSTKSVKRGDEKYEIAAVVRPRYGRIVLFRGIIPHSARPPSPGFKGARYSFACKVSKTYRSAQLKQLKETFETLLEFGDEEDEEIWEALENEEYEIPPEEEPNDFLQNEVAKQKQRLIDLTKDHQNFLLKKLSS